MPDRGCGPTEIGADDGNEEEDDCVVVLTSHWVSPVGRRLVEGFQMVKKLNLWCGLVIFLRIFFNNLIFVTSDKKNNNNFYIKLKDLIIKNILFY